jgi:hypothetical protein
LYVPVSKPIQNASIGYGGSAKQTDAHYVVNPNIANIDDKPGAHDGTLHRGCVQVWQDHLLVVSFPHAGRAHG